MDRKKEIVKGKGKDRKPFRKPEQGERIDVKPSKVCMNDPKWYFVTEDLLKSTASLSFPQWLGRGINLTGTTPTGVDEAIICRIPFYFSIGQSRGSDSPFNLAVRNLYTYVRHANSGHSNYESADLGIYLLSVGSAIAQCSHLERLLGVAKLYKTRNAAVPRKLLEALGVTDYNNLVANLAQYTARLNLMWARLSSFCLPTDFNFIKRWIWMSSQIFKDHESSKAALYCFVPTMRSHYDAQTLGTGGAFFVGDDTANDFDGTIASLFSDVEAALSNILADEDMNIMSGDILKAYGEDRLIKFGSTPIDYVVEPVYVEEMLPQIHNLRTGPVACIANGTAQANYFACLPREVAVRMSVADATSLSSDLDGSCFIYQVDGEIIEANTFTFANNNTVVASSGASFYYDSTSADTMRPSHNLMLNSYSEVPSPEEVTIATRLMHTYTYDLSTASNAWMLESSGTEVVPYLVMYSASAHGAQTLVSYIGTDFSGPTTANLMSYVFRIQLLPQFDWFPTIYTVGYSNGLVSHITSDVDNFTIVDNAFLSSIHTNAILGEFTVTAVNFLK